MRNAIPLTLTCPSWCEQPTGHVDDEAWRCHVSRVDAGAPGYLVEAALSVDDHTAPEPYVLVDFYAAAEVLTPPQARALAAALTTAADRAEGQA